MQLLNQNNLHPEEYIRQALIHKMVHELGFPISLISTEKSLSLLPHLSLVERKKIPNRRLDILVFGKNIHPHHSLYPLLMIECKATKWTQKAIDQVIGYNDVVKAPFIGIASQEGVMTGYYQKGVLKMVEGLYTYDVLLSMISDLKIS